MHHANGKIHPLTDVVSPLDDVNLTILRVLQDNARTSYAELGRRVGLTAPAVKERVQRMEEDGIITGYHAHVSTGALGFPISAIVRLALPRSSVERFENFVRQQPEIHDCRKITGDDCYALTVAASSTAHLHQLVSDLSRWGRTSTAVVISTPFTRRTI